MTYEEMWKELKAEVAEKIAFHSKKAIDSSLCKSTCDSHIDRQRRYTIILDKMHELEKK